MSFAMMTYILRLFYYLIYQPLAWSYDAVAALVSVGMWRDWGYSVLPYLNGRRVLELGHGPGHLQLRMQQRGLFAAGIDRSAQMGYLARRRLLRAQAAPHLARAQAQALPFANASFDQVVCTFPSEYFVAPETLAEVRRVLAPDGVWVILPVAWITGDSLWERLAAWLFRITGQAPAQAAPRWLGDLAAHFAQAGFSLTIRQEAVRHSQVLLLLAQVQAPESSTSEPDNPEPLPEV